MGVRNQDKVTMSGHKQCYFRLWALVILLTNHSTPETRSRPVSESRHVANHEVTAATIKNADRLKASKGELTRPGATVTLEARTADLSLRFNHVEPRVTSTDLIAYWSFDEGSGYEFSDASGNRHTSYITGGNWNTTDSGLTNSFHRNGKRAGCVYLNGTQWLEARHTSRLENSGQITVSAWIKPDQDLARAVGQAIVCKQRNSKGYCLSLGDKNNLRFAVQNGNVQKHFIDSQRETVTPGQWVHVASTTNATTGQNRIYINGALSGSMTVAPFSTGVGSGNLIIGRSDQFEGAFKGWIDEVSIHNRSLNDDEIRGLYAIGFPKVYAQTRETIDSHQKVWTRYRGNQPIPHPVEGDTIFSASYNGTLSSHLASRPSDQADASILFVPGQFGSSFDTVKNTKGLRYASPITTDEGTVEVWFVPVLDRFDPQRDGKKIIFRAAGANTWLELFSLNQRWVAAFGVRNKSGIAVQSRQQRFAYGQGVHLGVSCQRRHHRLVCNWC